MELLSRPLKAAIKHPRPEASFFDTSAIPLMVIRVDVINSSRIRDVIFASLTCEEFSQVEQICSHGFFIGA